MLNCPCCDHQMLRYISGSHSYWFCRYCWQEMPELSLKHSSSFLCHTRDKASVSKLTLAS